METTAKTARILILALWTAQLLLFTGLIWAGFTKLFTPATSLAAMWPWTAEHRNLVIITGIADLTGGLGLIPPSFFRGKSRLTVAAAFCIVVLMFAAAAFHIARGEASQIGINVTFAAFAGFVAWGRGRQVS